MLDHIVPRGFRRDLQLPDHVSQPSLGVADDDRPVPIGGGIAVELVEQRVAQEMMGIEHEHRLAGWIGDDYPSHARRIDLAQERIIGDAVEFRQHAALIGERQAQDALGVDLLALVADGDVVEIEEVLRAGRFQLADLDRKSVV